MNSNKWIGEMLHRQGIENWLSSEAVEKVYGRLIEIAKKGRGATISYGEVMAIADLDRENTFEREQVLGRMLGGISQHEMESGRPLLSSIVVYSTKPRMPGPGFFELFNNGREDVAWLNTVLEETWKYWSGNKHDKTA